MTDIGPGECWGSEYLARKGYRQADHQAGAPEARIGPTICCQSGEGVWTRFENRQTSSRSFQSGPRSTGLRSQPKQIFRYTV